jgi:hypothetical protein
MKNIFIIVFFVFGMISNIHSQSARSSFRTAERRINVDSLAEAKVLYLFDGFKKAVVYYPEREYAEFLINYRLLHDEISVKFTDSSTKALGTEKLFDSIIVDKRKFVYKQKVGYLEDFNSKHDLFIKHKTDYTMTELKPGAYGEASSTSAAQSVSVMAAGHRLPGELGKLVMLENTSGNEVQVTLTYTPKLGIVKNNEFIQINSRRGLNKYFPENKSEIKTFLRKNKISFSQRTDIIKLIEFLNNF